MTVISIAAPLHGGLGDMAYYYHVKIFPKQDPTHWEWKSDLHREQLEQRVLVPYREGRPITIDGKTTRMAPTPSIGEILNAAFSRAHAVVVLFTPDDEACLRQQFRSDSDPRHEVEPTGQARPNVLFEAGMAMGRDSNRTILVELGTLRPFSDIGGRHLLRIDDTSQQRQQLAQRLGTAGCPVRLDGIEWLTAGDFDAAFELAQASPQAAYAPIDSLLVEATRDSLGIIRKTRTLGGLTIETNGKTFGTAGDPESEADWEGALGELVERGLIKDKNDKDTVFRVTREGFHTARQLSNGGSQGVDSTSSGYRRVAHRDSKAVGESVREREDQAFIN